ncbi:MAG: DMT family transporter [Clostridiales Family XIII bacterium]|jgi:drug/metabolite transporter (DMT)-like permease|nr:DMT family transporter [Clostridiales Family XIII bacterium]
MRTKSIIYLILAGLFWSIGGVFIKTSGINPFVISSIRGGVAAIVFFLWLKGRPKFTFSRPQIIGAIAYSLVLTGFVLANSLTSAANAILLQYAAPVYVAIIGFFVLHEKLHWYDFIAIVGVIGGMRILMGNRFQGNSLAGDLIAFGSGIFYAIFIIALRKQKYASSYETVLLGNIFTFLIGFPFFFLHPPALAGLPPILFLGVIQIALPYLLFTAASKHAKAIDMSIFPVIEPLMNPVWVFLVTGENPGIRAVAGGAILLAVVAFKSIVELRKPSNQHR